MSITIRTLNQTSDRVSTRSATASIVGGSLMVVGLACWLAWFWWRVSTVSELGSTPGNVVGAVGVLALEVSAFAASMVLAASLWSAALGDVASGQSFGPLPSRFADAVGFVPAEGVGESSADWSRQGVATIVQAARNTDHSRVHIGWAILVTDGMRRMLAVVAVVLVLFTGIRPVAVPSPIVAALLATALASISLGQWVLSGGLIRPGARLVWSMESLGAGFGSGRSSTGLPVRWVTTMGTMVVLNIAVALRGLSDRWTHGLNAMDRDIRIVAMLYALSLVVVGHRALRRLPKPDLEFYGATQRLEEWSTRRLALGATFAMAVLGLVVGAMPTAMAW